MRYAYVENGALVEGPRSLPVSWRNISGFHLMGDAALKTLGWLPWIFIETSVAPDEVIAGYTVSVTSDAVIETRLVRSKTQEEKDAEIASRVEDMRRQRAAAYKEEADPLFFKWQRGEIPQSQWTEKVEEIRTRFPY